MIIITSEKILELLQYGERISLECKDSRNEISKSVWETYSAFANTCGGIILLGVKENMSETNIEKRFTFVDMKNPAARLKEFWDTINSNKVSANILLDENVGICEVDGHSVMWIDVPQADYRYKPVYINENPMKGSYKRNHEGDYHCTEEEVKSMLRDASDSGIDGGLLDGYTMDDIDLNTLKSYRIEYEHRNPDHVWNGLDDIEFLRNLGAYTVDRATKREGLTAAGLLMFGKGLAIRERFDNIRMDYLDQSNLSEGVRWNDRLTYDGSWENNLYNFIRRILPKLVSDLKKPFKLEGMVRIDDTMIHKAIREAAVNMIIHADYHSTGIIKVIKYEDGFLFSNPGNLKLPVQAIYEGGHSVARNPKIQNMFRMIGLGDNIGSGFPTILKVWGEEQWRQPDLYNDQELHQVDLRLWMVSLMPIECTEYLNKMFGMAYQRLQSEEQIILSTAFLEEKISNARIQSVLSMHSTDVGRLLCNLVEKHMLLVENKGRWTTYRINENYIQEPEQIELKDFLDPDMDLNGTDKLIYQFLCANETITTQQVVDIVDKISTKQGASVALNRLIDKDLIKKIRNGRRIYYIKN